LGKPSPERRHQSAQEGEWNIYADTALNIFRGRTIRIYFGVGFQTSGEKVMRGAHFTAPDRPSPPDLGGISRGKPKPPNAYTSRPDAVIAVDNAIQDRIPDG
jgi:hypothetical protein